MKNGKWLQRIVAFVLMISMCLSQSVWGSVEAKADTTSEFTLYFYSESTSTLYLDIWKHVGIEFADGTETSSSWGWDYSQGILKAVEGNSNWYQISLKIVDATAADGFDIYAGNSSTKAATYDSQWNNTTDYATLIGGSSTTYAIKGGVIYQSIEEATKTDEGNADENDTAVDGKLNITKVQNLSDDFIMGMDISSVISLFDSGVTYRDYDGNAITNVTDFCKFLASNGITHIRVRVWNDPYDSDGKGYGGGNNDVAKAKTIADACREAGLKMLVDFHCSDLWTDPSKQQAPKAWKDYTLEEKQTALKEYIQTSLNTIDPKKDTVDMVQVGNETTSGFVGETDTANMCKLFSAGSAGVRAYNSSVKVVIHVTNPEKQTVTTWAKNLSDNNVDYDILATSYYPYWHGTLDNLKSQFQKVKETYGKDVMVAETSYAYTLNDSDGHDNTVRVGNNDTGSDTTEPFTEQGQATAIRNLINAVNEAGGLGVFYWEPAWITVGDTTGLTGDAYDEQVTKNKALWEKYGSGWASSYASEYDAADAGKWFGGSAVDNEAMFYPDGTPTPALYVWNYVKTGSKTDEVFVDYIDKDHTLNQTIKLGESYELPKTVSVTYAGTAVEENVTWNESDIDKVDVKTKGEYTISGTVSFSKEITQGAYKGAKSAEVSYTLSVLPANLITDAKDAGFEKGENFTISGSGISAIPSSDDPYSGEGSMHWWSETATSGTVTYKKPISLEAGSYTFDAVAQGAAGDKVTLQICDENGKVLGESTPAELDGWINWQTPSLHFTVKAKTTILLQVAVAMQDGGWGTADNLYLYEDEAATDGFVIGEEPNQPDNSGTTVTPSTSDNIVVTTKPDGSTTEIKTENATNAAGKKVEITTTTEKDATGKVTGSKVVSVIKSVAKDTTATVTVNKSAAGSVTAATATITKTGIVNGSTTKGTISATVVKQVQEAAGRKNVAMVCKVVDASGKTKFTLKANAKNLQAGQSLYLYKQNTKTGAYTMVNSKTYKVSAAGNVSVSMDTKATYELVDKATSDKITKSILATVKAAKSSRTVKKGGKITFKLNTKLNQNNVKSITYTSTKKSVATVSKSGKVTAKKAGTAKVKAKVTLKNGKTKTVSMKVTVK